MVIWKWNLQITDKQTITMPAGAEILDAQVQGESLCLWAMCHQTENKENRHFAIYGTGNPMPDYPGKYIATFQIRGGTLVFHVFEV